MINHLPLSTGGIGFVTPVRQDFTNWCRDVSKSRPMRDYIVLLKNGTVRIMQKSCEGEWSCAVSGRVPAYEVVAFAEVLNREV